MLEKSIVTLGTFDKNLKELTKIQKTFITPSAKFIYFRKGEAENNIAIAAAIIGLLYIIYKMIENYPEFKLGAQAILSDVRVKASFLKRYISERPSTKLPKHPEIREISCPCDPDITMTLEILRSISCDVRYLPTERAGKFRYFLNDKQYCLFIRRNNGEFNGVFGNDPKMITALKETFESEWKELGPIQEQVTKTIPGITEALHWDT